MSSGATTMAAAVVGALIGSAPGWAALLVSNRRALDRQTSALKTHITDTAAQAAPTQDGGEP